MERPNKIYLDEPIEIEGIKIGHTRLGAQYMAEHYQSMLDNATKQQLGDNERQHLQTIISRLRKHIAIYEGGDNLERGTRNP